MTSSSLAIIIYYVTGGVLSALMAAKTHFGILFAAIALPFLYVAHLCWKALGRKRQARDQDLCLTCEKSIGLFRQLSNHRFCCHEHQVQWFDELGKAAIERLQSYGHDGPAAHNHGKRTADPNSAPDDGDFALVLASN